VPPPDPSFAARPGVLAAAPSVVRVSGFACGLGVEGSGWIAAPGVVVTNAHVVAGVLEPRVDRRDGFGLAPRLQMELDDAGEHPLTAALLRVHADRMRRWQREHALTARFTSAHPDVAMTEVTALAGDVHDLDGLREVGASMAKA